jgi:hypothetical protein
MGFDFRNQMGGFDQCLVLASIQIGQKPAAVAGRYDRRVVPIGTERSVLFTFLSCLNHLKQ